MCTQICIGLYACLLAHEHVCNLCTQLNKNTYTCSYALFAHTYMRIHELHHVHDAYIHVHLFTFVPMVKSAEKSNVTNPGYALHHSETLPSEDKVHWVQSRAHNFELPWKDTRNFLARQLYSDIYCAKHF